MTISSIQAQLADVSSLFEGSPPSDGIRVAQADAVLEVIVDRPAKRNALRPEDVIALEALLRQADTSQDVRCILLAADGDDFCTGIDVSDIGAAAAPELLLDRRRSVQVYQRLFAAYWTLETPVVAAVHGAVAGIGVMLALLADIVVAASDARWTHAFLRRGMVPHAGDAYFLRRVLPLHALNEFALLGRTHGTEDLHRWGAVNIVTSAEVVRDEARAVAVELAAGPTRSIGAAKTLYRRSLDSSMETSFLEEEQLVALVAETRDRSEGITARIEGRRPRFEGR